MDRADIGQISRTVFTHPAAPPWFNVVLPEPSIKILYEMGLNRLALDRTEIHPIQQDESRGQRGRRGARC